MMANGTLVRVLIHTDVTKYLFFKAVDGSYVFNKGKVQLLYYILGPCIIMCIHYYFVFLRKGSTFACTLLVHFIALVLHGTVLMIYFTEKKGLFTSLQI